MVTDSQGNTGTEENTEPRRYRRIDCGGEADIRVLPNGGKEAGSLLNLSKRGCCFVADQPLRGVYGSAIEVHMKVRGTDLRVAGVIRHVHQQMRAGIEFIALSERKCEQIDELIAELTELEERGANGQSEARNPHEQENLSRGETGRRARRRLLRFERR